MRRTITTSTTTTTTTITTTTTTTTTTITTTTTTTITTITTTTTAASETCNEKILFWVNHLYLHDSSHYGCADPGIKVLDDKYEEGDDFKCSGCDRLTLEQDRAKQQRRNSEAKKRKLTVEHNRRVSSAQADKTSLDKEELKRTHEIYEQLIDTTTSEDGRLLKWGECWERAKLLAFDKKQSKRRTKTRSCS